MLWFLRFIFKVMEPEMAEGYHSVTYADDKATFNAYDSALVPTGWLSHH
jgi:hypothetical protein